MTVYKSSLIAQSVLAGTLPASEHTLAFWKKVKLAARVGKNAAVRAWKDN